MSELINTFTFIIALSLFSFWLVFQGRPNFVSHKELKSWTTAWLSLVFIAFAAHNIWLAYLVLIGLFRFLIPSAIESKVNYYLLLFCSLPQLAKAIPSAFGINSFLDVTYPHFLVLSLFFLIPSKNKNTGYKTQTTDKFAVLYIILISALSFRGETITTGLRSSVVIVLNTYLPYYVLSRHISTTKHLNMALAALFVGLVPVAVIGIFEAVRHWHLYDALTLTLTEKSARAVRYDVRANLLRGTSVFVGPIVFGYVMVIGIGLLLYLQPFIRPQYYRLAIAGFCLALICSVSRGAWVGGVILIFAYLWTGKEAVKKSVIIGLSGVLALALLSLTEVGEKIIDVLPIIGTQRADTIDYREQLLEVSWSVIWKRPWFGTLNFHDLPEMQVMVQGTGIIDVVNSYLGIALKYGVIAVSLFVILFFGLLFNCYKIINKLPSEEEDMIRMGRVLFATMLSVLVLIFTVSSLDYVPLFYWALAGIMVAYINVSRQRIDIAKTGSNLQKLATS